MRTMKIVADSSANMISLDAVSFASAPLKVITDGREFVDDAAASANEMLQYFDTYKGKSKTSCPNTVDWLDAFGDAEDIFCVTITSGLSGSYNSACVAKQAYEADYPNRRVFMIDSLSAGPELVLIIEKLQSLILEGFSFEEICAKIKAYQETTGLVFVLESLKNFAANGRVSPAIAKIAGVLGIRIVGEASAQGTLAPINKCRGEVKSLNAMLNHMKENGLKTGKVRIAHCMNKAAAQELKRMILEAYPKVDIQIQECRILCSYYAEKGGMLVGYEKN